MSWAHKSQAAQVTYSSFCSKKGPNQRPIKKIRGTWNPWDAGKSSSASRNARQTHLHRITRISLCMVWSWCSIGKCPMSLAAWNSRSHACCSRSGITVEPDASHHLTSTSTRSTSFHDVPRNVRIHRLERWDEDIHQRVAGLQSRAWPVGINAKPTAWTKSLEPSSVARGGWNP